jgi:hypothetical protein
MIRSQWAPCSCLRLTVIRMAWSIFLAALLHAPLTLAAYGLDAPAAVGPFLNGVFPTQTPNAPGSSTWTVVPAFPNVRVDNALVIEPNPANNRMYVGSRD